jgi:hypothetical protein
MKRALAVLVVLAVGLSLFACLSGGKEMAAPPSSGKESVAEAPKTAPEGETRKDSEESGAAAVRGAAAGSASPETAWSVEEAPAPPPPAGEPAVAARAAERRGAAPAASGLKAGFADDNKQFNYFVQFLSTYGPQVHFLPMPVEERIVVRVGDRDGRCLPSASIVVRDEAGRLLCQGSTYADGSFLFFPAEYGAGTRYELTIGYNQAERRVWLDRQGPREVPVAFDAPRGSFQAVPLDLLFILDTTGSMGEEIQRLKRTIEIINLNLASLSSKPRVRFGLVLYRDRGDEYVTRVVPFTDNLRSYQDSLDRVEAGGGGDTPEDLQAALEAAMGMDWNRSGIRLGFVITDAPPHLDYGQSYTYVQAVHKAREKGIKVFSVGTGGLDLQGEIVLRQISQYTSAKYIFLTYGESGESEGGAPGSVSHHTGANYQTDKLEAIIIRFAKEELAHLTDQPVEEGEEYFTAEKVTGEEREQTLGKLFSMAVSQLIDYSSVRIPAGTPAAVLPLSPAEENLALNAEYFTESLQLSFVQDEGIRRTFRIVERKDLQGVLDEMELRLSDLVDSVDTANSGSASRIGAVIGADLLFMGKLYRKSEGYELFLKLVRVQTGEILSVTKARIDRGLGLES